MIDKVTFHCFEMRLLQLKAKQNEKDATQRAVFSQPAPKAHYRKKLIDLV